MRPSVHYLSLFTALTLSSGVTIQCPGSSSGSCKCQATENIACPAGFYCPGYSAETITSLGDLVETSNCTVRTDGQLQCPCTPGFFCPANTLTPSYCCAGVSFFVFFFNLPSFCSSFTPFTSFLFSFTSHSL